MPYETIALDVTHGIATITLARPDAYNALNLALARELFGAVLEVDEDPAVRCVVVTGSGKAFCGGGDVKDFAQDLLADRDPPEGADDVHPRRRLAARADAEARDHGRQRRGGRGRALAGAGGRPRGRRRVGPVHHGLLADRGHAGRVLDLLAAAARRHPSRDGALLHEPGPHRDGGRGLGDRHAGRPRRGVPRRRAASGRRARPGADPGPRARASGSCTSRRRRVSRPRWSTRARRSRRAGTRRISPRACARSPRSARPSSAGARAPQRRRRPTGGGAWPERGGPASRHAWPRGAASPPPSGSPPGGRAGAARPGRSSAPAGPSGRTPCRPR